MALAFIPVYIQQLGIEGWGLVGFMATLLSWLALVDLGLAPTMNREMARFQAGDHTVQGIRDILRSAEIIYGGIIVAVIATTWGGAEWISTRWLQPEKLSVESIRLSVVLMGAAIAARITEQLYRSSIEGLQHQLGLNLARSLNATMQWMGAAAVVLWVSPTVEAFFAWQAVTGWLGTALLAFLTYRWLPPGERKARWNAKRLRSIRRFATGMAVISILAVVLTQVDKMLISSLASLEQFGYYMLASTMVSALFLFVVPLVAAVAPRMIELVARDEKSGVISIYHHSSQFVSVVLIPPSLVMALFAEPLLWAWIGDHRLASVAAGYLTPLAIGTLLNGLMHVPYRTQLAYGWTGLTMRANLLAVTILIPAIIITVPVYGAIAAAWMWVVLNAGYVVLAIPVMHCKILSGEMWRWYGEDVLKPFVAGLIVVGGASAMQITMTNRLSVACILIGIVALGLCATVLASKQVRKTIILELGKLRSLIYG
jgi:O-antigen/teichoic acid export membrane protein